MTLQVLALVSGGWALAVTLKIPAQEGRKPSFKCYGETLAKEELISIVTSADYPFQLDVSAMESHGRKKPGNPIVFSERDRKEIRTAFTASDTGEYLLCLYNSQSQELTIRMELKTGPDAKDYSQIANKEHLEPSEVTLRKIEEVLRNYHRNVLYMRQREDHMRKINDSTASRIIGFCLFSVALMIVLGGWQMYYFKQFFKSKKII